MGLIVKSVCSARKACVTCTILPEENEQVTQAFLAEHTDFTMSPIELPQPVGTTSGALTLWPQRHDTDGFYICRMTRR